MYDDYYDITPLLTFMAAGRVQEMPKAVLRDKLIVALFCTTLARSADIANAVPMVYTDGQRRYVRFLDKQGRNRLLAVGDLLAYDSFPSFNI